MIDRTSNPPVDVGPDLAVARTAAVAALMRSPRDDWHRARRHIPPPGGCDCTDDVIAAQAVGARMALEPGAVVTDAQIESEWRHRYPWGEHSRPGKLTEAELDEHYREWHTPTRMERMRKWWREFWRAFR